MVDQNIQDGFTKIYSDKGKIATAITNKGIVTQSTDTLELMASNIDKIEQGGSGIDDSFIENPPTILTIENATQIMPYFYYFNSNDFLNKTIELINLKNVIKLRGYNFSLSSSSFSIKIKKVKCPKLTQIETNCFNYILESSSLDKDSFPELEILTRGFSGYIFNEDIGATPKIIFPKLKTIDNRVLPGWNLTQLTEINFPSLETIPSSSSWKTANANNYSVALIFPKLTDYADLLIDSTNGKYKEFSFNACNKFPKKIYNGLITTKKDSYMLYVKKVILPKAEGRSNLVPNNNSETITGPWYGHFKYPKITNKNYRDTFDGFNFLIFGFKETNSNYNLNSDLQLPYLSGNHLKALIFQQGSDKFYETEDGKSANTYLLEDLNNESMCTLILAGLHSTEGYLYLSNLDYDAFMITEGEEGTNKKQLQNRTRKWSEYKELLVNEYGLDSIADWYD